MAQDLRARITTTILVALGATSCDLRPDPPAAEAERAIREACLGQFADRFREITLELRESDDSEPTTVLVDARDRVRIRHASGRTVVIGDRGAFGWNSGQDAEPLDDEERKATIALRALCRAALLAPLCTGAAPERVGPQTLHVGPVGKRWKLEYSETRPRSIISGHGQVKFVEFKKKPPHLPRVVEIGALGRRTIRLLGHGANFQDATFEPPDAQRDNLPELEISSVAEPRTPVFWNAEPCSWLCAKDPGTWEARRATCRTLGTALYAAKMKSAGDPFLFRDGDEDWLAIPFVPRDPDGPAFEPDDGQVVRPGPEGYVAAVQAPQGTFADRVAAGRAKLDAFLAEHRRDPAGPMRVVVNIVHRVDLVEGSEAERTCSVRVEYPVSR